LTEARIKVFTATKIQAMFFWVWQDTNFTLKMQAA